MNHTSNIIIMGIDPGTNTGISIIEMTQEYEIIKIDTFSINLNNYIVDTLSNFEKEADRLIALEEGLRELLEKYNPDLVGMENAFFNKKFPLSGLKLSSFLGVIIMTIRKYSRSIKVYKLQPKYIKSVVATGNAYKDDMELAVKENLELGKHINFESETEHSIDAVAIGYSVKKLLEKYPYVLNNT